MFTDNIDPITSNVVATICIKDLITKGVGTVSWSWTYDEVQLHTKKLNNLLYFMVSPVNIISANAMDGPMKDDEGTWVPTKIKYSIFTWYVGKYKKTIAPS